MCCSESEIALKKEKGVDYFKDLGFWGRERPRSPDNAAARGLQSPGHGGGLGRWGLLLLLWVLLVANDRKPTQNPFVGEIPSVGYKRKERRGKPQSGNRIQGAWRIQTKTRPPVSASPLSPPIISACPPPSDNWTNSFCSRLHLPHIMRPRHWRPEPTSSQFWYQKEGLLVSRFSF